MGSFLLLIIFLIIINVKLNQSYTTHYYVRAVLRNNEFLWSENETAWDKDWKNKLGIISVDTCPYIDTVLVPKENTYYCALPYNDLDQYGRKANAFQIPWSSSSDPDDVSILKNRWIKVSYKDAMAFCQYEDVGPEFDDDFSYVFGTSHSIAESRYGGIGISTDVAKFLGVYHRFKPLVKLRDDQHGKFGYENKYYHYKNSQSPDDDEDEDGYEYSSMNSISDLSFLNLTLSPSSFSSTSIELNETIPNSSSLLDNNSEELETETETPMTIPTITFDPNSIPDFHSSDEFTLLSYSNSKLKSEDSDVRCTWQFIDDKDVPDGPWKKIVTTSPSDKILKDFVRHNEK